MAGLCLYQSSPGPMPPEPPAPEPPPIPEPSSSSSSTAEPEPSTRPPEPSPDPCADTVDATAEDSVDETGASMSNSELPSMSIRPGSITILLLFVYLTRSYNHRSWSFFSTLRWYIIIDWWTLIIILHRTPAIPKGYPAANDDIIVRSDKCAGTTLQAAYLRRVNFITYGIQIWGEVLMLCVLYRYVGHNIIRVWMKCTYIHIHEFRYITSILTDVGSLNYDTGTLCGSWLCNICIIEGK